MTSKNKRRIFMYFLHFLRFELSERWMKIIFINNIWTIFTFISQNGWALVKKRDPPMSDPVKIEYSTKNITFDRSKKRPCNSVDCVETLKEGALLFASLIFSDFSRT